MNTFDSSFESIKCSIASEKANLIPAIVIHADWPPEEDEGAASLLRPLAESAVNEIKVTGRYKLQYLFGTDLDEQNIQKILASVKDEKGILIFFGHGCRCGEALLAGASSGPTNAKIAIGASMSDLLANKVVYVVGCHSAKGLGSDSVRRGGARFYIGYRNWIPAPAIDGKSIPELTAAYMAGVNAIVNGRTCGEAYEQIVNEYEKQVMLVLTKIPIALALLSAYDALSPPLGNLNAKV